MSAIAKIALYSRSEQYTVRIAERLKALPEEAMFDAVTKISHNAGNLNWLDIKFPVIGDNLRRAKNRIKKFTS